MSGLAATVGRGRPGPLGRLHPLAPLAPLDPAGRAIVQLSDRLSALTPDDPDRYAVTVLGPRAPVRAAQANLTAGWWPVSPPVRLIDAMRSGHGRHLSISPAVAGATMIASLGYAAAGRLAVALAVTGRAYDTGPESLAVKLDQNGLVQRIAVRRPTVVVLPGDLLTSRTSAAVLELPDLTAAIGWAARRAWATLDPLIDELHRRTRYGRVPMWNLVADAVLGPATVASRLAGLDQQAGRAVGVALLDALVGHGAPIHRYGTVCEDPDAGPPAPALSPIRGSCCLRYRLAQEKCDSCPLLSRRP